MFWLAPKYQGFPETTLFHSGVFSKTPWLALALMTMPVRGLLLPQGHFVAIGYRSELRELPQTPLRSPYIALEPSGRTEQRLSR